MKKDETIVGLTLEEAEAIECEDYTPAEKEEFEEMYNANTCPTELRPGAIVKGTIIKVIAKEVVVDIGYKSEGRVMLSEFKEGESVVPGMVIDVLIETLDGQEDLVSVSKEKAHFHTVWTDIKNAYDTGAAIKGTVAKRIKGGLKVRIMGVEAFLPGSQIALRQVVDLDDYIGEEFDFKVIKLNKRRRNIVVSRRQLLEEARAEKKDALIEELEEGQIRIGVVKNITDFGAFVDLGGIDGLLHITDMSWGRVRHPSRIVSIGDEIEVQILKYDHEKERISLGLKQLQEFPWDAVTEKYPVDTIIKGTVASLTDYGAFVELEPGIEGLVHISEMSWTKHIRHPSRILSIGDEIEIMILSVDEEKRKISLGLKQTIDNPWDTISERYPIGTKIEGKVRNLTSFGAFVEIENGIDGLVHISDMSWTKRINHPSDVLGKGDEINVVVLSIDKDNARISLGLKQTMENPWDTMDGRYPEGQDIKGQVVQILDRGVVVSLDEDIEGFVPQSQLGWEELENPEEIIRVGDELPLRVIEMEASSRRIVLSVRSYFNGKPMEELDEFRKSLEGREPLKVEKKEPESTQEIDTEVTEPETDERPTVADEDSSESEPADSDTVSNPEDEIPEIEKTEEDPPADDSAEDTDSDKKDEAAE